jgi:predicted nucleic acid-binding protein
MVTTVAEAVFVDTNVLLAATDEGRADHAGAVEVLQQWPASGTVLYTSGQILREYLVVTTRPTAVNGLGLSRRDAVVNVERLRTRLRFLDESEKVGERLLALVAETDCSGKQIHDANVVATMLVHGIGTVVTRNTSDFSRFDRHIHVTPLKA